MKLETTIIAKAANYYIKGLSYKEIGKLLDLSPRTVQRYINQSECKQIAEPKTLQQLAIDLTAQGFSYSEIAKKLKKSRTTIYRWNKKAKERAATVAVLD